MKEKIAGTIYGMALGDAFGMPSELWPKETIKEYFGHISTLLEGPRENEVAKNYKRGQFTDDTGQALVFLDSLFSTNFKPDIEDLSRRLLKWAEDNSAFERNILGPTSRAILSAIKNGQTQNLKNISDKAISNGSAMRIAPIGCLFHPTQSRQIAEYVKVISSVTHSSDISIAGSSIIAQGISSAMVYDNFDDVLSDILNMEKISRPLGERTASPSLTERIKLAIFLANKYKSNQELFLDKLYDLIGTGVNISESVPAAIAISYYSQDPNRAAELSANLGGDTDTIGSMSTAICGAFLGFNSINSKFIEILDRANPIDFNYYIEHLYKQRFKI